MTRYYVSSCGSVSAVGNLLMPGQRFDSEAVGLTQAQCEQLEKSKRIATTLKDGKFPTHSDVMIPPEQTFDFRKGDEEVEDDGGEVKRAPARAPAKDARRAPKEPDPEMPATRLKNETVIEDKDSEIRDPEIWVFTDEQVRGKDLAALNAMIVERGGIAQSSVDRAIALLQSDR